MSIDIEVEHINSVIFEEIVDRWFQSQRIKNVVLVFNTDAHAFDFGSITYLKPKCLFTLLGMNAAYK